MRENIRSTNLRFNLEKDIHKRAWQYLQNMDKKIFRCYSNVIAIALVEYNDVKIKLISKIAEKKRLTIEQKKCGIHFIRANKLEERITTLVEDIEELKYRKNQLLAQLNCKGNSIAS